MMKFIKTIIRFFVVTVLDGRFEIDSIKLRRQITTCYFYHDKNMCHNIIKVRFFEHKDKYTAELTTFRPGIIIGKAGRDINMLKDWLCKEFDKPIEIELVESKIWVNIY